MPRGSPRHIHRRGPLVLLELVGARVRDQRTQKRGRVDVILRRLAALGFQDRGHPALRREDDDAGRLRTEHRPRRAAVLEFVIELQQSPGANQLAAIVGGNRARETQRQQAGANHCAHVAPYLSCTT